MLEEPRSAGRRWFQSFVKGRANTMITTSGGLSAAARTFAPAKGATWSWSPVSKPSLMDLKMSKARVDALERSERRPRGLWRQWRDVALRISCLAAPRAPL